MLVRFTDSPAALSLYSYPISNQRRTLIETNGLKGVWLLEQLDRTGLGTLKLLLLLALIGGVMGSILALITGPVAPESVFASNNDETATWVSMVTICITIGLVLGFIVMLVRTTEADLQHLSTAGNYEVNSNLLILKASVFLPIVVVIALFTTLVIPVLASQRLEVSLIEAFKAFYAGGAPLRLLMFVLFPVVGLAWGTGVAIGVTQVKCLITAARTIPIDLFQLTHYEALTNPTIRVLSITLVLTSVFPVFMLLMNDPIVNEQMTKLMIAALLILTPVLAAWCYPTLILRNRIRLKKAQELDNLLLAILGDDEALGRSCIPKRGNQITTADLLVHQMFIESRWEWPIASHVQKLILFGLLPPLTWVLAAMMENLLY
ncbi:MAG: hypothetical protein ACI82A_004284 [Candidatus Azotimanducaceae bacterium]|jgi:hypothetical protein